MTTPPPPTKVPLVQDKSGFPTLQWLVFLNGLFNGDPGNVWTPEIQNLQVTGDLPSVVGRTYQISKYLVYFSVTIIPASGSKLNATAGNWLISNLPYEMLNNGICFAVSGELGTVGGMIDGGQGVIFPPSLVNVTVPVTIVGLVEASGQSG